jgi:hypothetical protein
MPEFRNEWRDWRQIAEAKKRLANKRAKRLADPAFWEANARIQRHPEFRQAALNYAKRLRGQ